MSQLALATKMNTSPMQVSRWERDEVTPTVESCRDLQRALGVSLDWLINGVGDPPAEGPLEATGTEG